MKLSARPNPKVFAIASAALGVAAMGISYFFLPAEYSWVFTFGMFFAILAPFLLWVILELRF